MSVVAIISHADHTATSLRPLAGRPTLAYAVNAAQGATSVDRVIVPTNKPDVVAIVRALGAETRSWRHLDENEKRHLKPYDPILHQYELQNDNIEIVVQITLDACLILPQDIDNVVNAIRVNQVSNAQTALPMRRSFFRRKQANSALATMEGNYVDDMRAGIHHYQTSPAIVAFHADWTRDYQNIYQNNNTALVDLPEERSLLLKRPIDWQIAELYLREREKENKRAILPDLISAVIMDFDGVFTDNKVVVFQDGREAVLCSRFDGYGLNQLQKTGVPMLVISKEPNPVVAARCAKLKIECIQGIDDKLPVLKAWLAERNLDISQTIYVGNDTNDAECLAAVGCGVVPSDAHPEVVPLARLVLNAPGGNGALREFCDLITGKEN